MAAAVVAAIVIFLLSLRLLLLFLLLLSVFNDGRPTDKICQYRLHMEVYEQLKKRKKTSANRKRNASDSSYHRTVKTVISMLLQNVLKLRA